MALQFHFHAFTCSLRNGLALPFTLAIGLLVVISAIASPASADVVAHWRFESGTANVEASGAGSLLDSSGNNLHATPFQGTVTGGPTYRSVSNPGSSLGLEFDGLDDRAFVADNSLFELTESLTLEAFVRLDSLGTGQIVFRGDSRASLDPYFLAVLGGKLAFHVENSAGTFSRVQSTLDLPTGQFVHVAGTLDDATGAQRLFVDGIEVASTTTTVRPFASLGGFFGQPFGVAIGSLQSGNAGFSGQFFDGIIDEVRISDRALSTSQFLISVPEPSSLVAIGLCSLVFLNRRRSR